MPIIVKFIILDRGQLDLLSTYVIAADGLGKDTEIWAGLYDSNSIECQDYGECHPFEVNLTWIDGNVWDIDVRPKYFFGFTIIKFHVL